MESCYRAEAQQLAQIYDLLRQNEAKFGKTSIEEVKSQMGMYKVNWAQEICPKFNLSVIIQRQLVSA